MKLVQNLRFVIKKVITVFVLVILSITILNLNIITRSQSENLRQPLGIVNLSNASPVAENSTWFVQTLKPGESKIETLKVGNPGITKSTVNLFAKDFSQSLDGSFNFRANDDMDKEVGKMIKLDKTQIELDGEKVEEVKFTISVPKLFPAGEYAGVVAGEVVGPESSTNINIKTRVGARVYITVPGDLKTGVKVSDIEFMLPGSNYYLLPTRSTNPEEAFLTYNLENTGNVFEKVTLNIDINTPSGKISKTIDKELAPRQFPVRVVTDLGIKWEEGLYSANISTTTKPIISSNKLKTIDLTDLKATSMSATVTSKMIDELKQSARFLISSSDSSSTNSSSTNSNSSSNTSDSTKSSNKSDANTAYTIIGFTTLFILVFAVIIIVIIVRMKKLDDKKIELDKVTEIKIEQPDIVNIDENMSTNNVRVDSDPDTSSEFIEDNQTIGQSGDQQSLRSLKDLQVENLNNTQSSNTNTQNKSNQNPKSDAEALTDEDYS